MTFLESINSAAGRKTRKMASVVPVGTDSERQAG